MGTLKATIWTLKGISIIFHVGHGYIESYNLDIEGYISHIPCRTWVHSRFLTDNFGKYLTIKKASSVGHGYIKG